MAVILGRYLLQLKISRILFRQSLFRANFFTDHLPIIQTNVDPNSDEFKVSQINKLMMIFIDRFYLLQ